MQKRKQLELIQHIKQDDKEENGWFQNLQVTFNISLLNCFTTTILECLQIGANIQRKAIERVDWHWVNNSCEFMFTYQKLIMEFVSIYIILLL